MPRLSACLRCLNLALVAVFTLLICDLLARRGCFGSLVLDQSSANTSVSRLYGPPLPRKLRLQAKAVLHSQTGPNSFAAMGDAVADLISIFEYQHSASASSLDDGDIQLLSRSLKNGVLHLFPFLQDRYQHAMADLEHHKQHSKGLVIPCGSSGFHFALHLVAAVRHVFNSTLPIEIMYAGDEDLPEPQRQALAAVGPSIATVNLLHFYNESTVGLKDGGWAIKPFCLLASSFEQVIMADSDIVFLQPPDSAFQHPGYKATGTLFYHDRVLGGARDVHAWWRGIMELRHPSQIMKSRFWAGDTVHEMESGMVIFDKGRRPVLIGLLYVAWMNTKVVREQATYKFTLGEPVIPALRCAFMLHHKLQLQHSTL